MRFHTFSDMFSYWSGEEPDAPALRFFGNGAVSEMSRQAFYEAFRAN